MRRLIIILVSISAMMAGFYLSARHFAEPVEQTLPPSDGSLVGSKRPHFELSNNRGEMVSVKDFEDKTILINFWATWCGPCREEMPMLVDLQSQHADRGLQVVGIALDDAQVVNNFVQTFGISYPILVGEADVFNVSAAFGNQEGVLPFSVLIDRKGVVRWQFAGKLNPGDVDKWLSEVL
jgi:thiol-disulfide isomerase/thioredoxin